MNKNTKIRLNYAIGALLSSLLLVLIWYQVRERTGSFRWSDLSHHGSYYWLALGLMLLPLNLGLEVLKWKTLASHAASLTWKEATASYFAGIACSFFTPNRIGEYPGRLLYLKKANTPRLISVSVLGAFGQLFAALVFGNAGLIFYYWRIHTTPFTLLVLALSLLLLVLLATLYFRFEAWAPRVEQIPWLRRFHTYVQLIHRFTLPEQLIVLAISMFRFLVFTSQYLLLLAWMNVDLPLIPGFLLSCLFFWAITVAPSIALLELGVRGSTAVFLFSSYSGNYIGMFVATALLWCVNLMLPAVAGSFLLIRMRWLS